MECFTAAGVGLFKGKSLCLTQADAVTVNLRFSKLMKNKMAHDQEAKMARH